MEIYKEYDCMYILEMNGKKTHRLAFMAIFMSHCPHFWGAEVIYMAMALCTCLGGIPKTHRF
jgi:hypothetical protein